MQSNLCIGDLGGRPSRWFLISRVAPRSLDQMMPVHQSKRTANCHFPLAKCCSCHVFVFNVKHFFFATLRAVGELCADMEYVGSSDCWVSSITSAHKIWATELGYPTPGLLGSSCKICSMLLQQFTVALNIFFVPIQGRNAAECDR